MSVIAESFFCESYAIMKLILRVRMFLRSLFEKRLTLAITFFLYVSVFCFHFLNPLFASLIQIY